MISIINVFGADGGECRKQGGEGRQKRDSFNDGKPPQIRQQNEINSPIQGRNEQVFFLPYPLLLINMASRKSLHAPRMFVFYSNQSLDQFTIASPPTDAISALKFSPDPDSTRFIVSSWDKNVYLYDLRDENGNVGEGKLLQKFEQRAPVLDVCFGANEDEIYTAGLDWDVRK